MPANIEMKVDTSVGPNIAQAKMLLVWIGEYHPGLLSEAAKDFNVGAPAPELTPEEQVESGLVEGVQLAIDDQPGEDNVDKGE